MSLIEIYEYILLQYWSVWIHCRNIDIMKWIIYLKDTLEKLNKALYKKQDHLVE